MNSLSLLGGGHGLLCWPSGPFDMPHSAKPLCIGTFCDPIKLNTPWMMGPTME